MEHNFMPEMKIRYKKGYKYQLVEDCKIHVNVFPKERIETDWIELEIDGKLLIKKGYAWDGPSGPTFDTPSSMRGALVHDALYQLMRLGLLEKRWRYEVDNILHDLCVEDKMIVIRADIWWMFVRYFADYAADPKYAKKVLEAP